MSARNTAAAEAEDAYDWSVDLAQRLTATRPEDTIRGLFMNGILEVLRTVKDEATAKRCLEASGVKKYVDFFSYPGTTNLKLTFAAAEALSSTYGSFEEALKQLGRRATADFLGSATGKTLRVLTGNRPTAMVNSIPGAYRASVSYGERAVTWTGPTSGRLSIHGDLMPWPFHEGVLLAVLEATDVRGARVHTHRRALLEGDYAFSWE
jgi:uncharacterized protein (TIGR02265 family)